MLGGWLTDNYSWRWVFYINIPVGIVAVIDDHALHLRPALHQAAASARIDYWGIGLLAIGIGALQIVLDKGAAGRLVLVEPDHRAARSSPSSALVGARRPRAARPRIPIIDLRVFRERTYATGVFLITLIGFVLYGSLVLLPIMLQTLLGYPAAAGGHRHGAARASGRSSRCRWSAS